MEYLAIGFFLLLAMTGVTLIATLGSFASRKLGFDYSLLTPVTFIIYTSIGFVIAGIDGLGTAILVGLVLGFYDATVCLKLSRLCKPRVGPAQKLHETLTYEQSLTAMAFFSIFCCLLGYGIRWILYGM